MNEEPPIPEMREALLDESNVRALLADWLACTQIEQVFVKDSLRSQQPGSGLQVEVAIEEFLHGRFAAVQVRYAFEGYGWTDTLMRVGEGIRMVRCRHESPNNSPLERDLR
jgi:hypothetical protein